MIADNELVFANEDAVVTNAQRDSWKVLLVDDEQAVHDVTLLALHDFEYEGKTIEFLHAFSVDQAQQAFEQHADIAVALVDVVMETDHAGIELVKWIREELKNPLVRLILRTGQPGQAPEKQIILNHDINDYKEKTELTSAKLFTLMVTSLRSYESLHALERHRDGLLKMVESSRGLATHGSIESFVEGVLLQLQAVFGVDETAFYCNQVEDEKQNAHRFQDFLVVTGNGAFSGTEVMHLADIAGSGLEQGILSTIRARSTQFIESSTFVYFESETENQCVLFFDRLNQPLDATEKRLLDVFCSNINYAFDNLSLNKEIDNSQREAVYTLGNIAEFRSHETGRHIVRVSKYAERLGQLYGLPEEESELILMAMPMHDIGKIAIQETILHKPDLLNQNEMDIMKTHTQIGYEMLQGSHRPLFRAAAVIAQQHHEHWDGNGYPAGLKGDEIHLYARIAAVADVFDALGNERSYKNPWPLPKIIDYFESQRGKHFDPEITDLLLSNIHDFVELGHSYSDHH